jgi:hypothetical protein
MTNVFHQLWIAATFALVSGLAAAQGAPTLDFAPFPALPNGAEVGTSTIRPLRFSGQGQTASLGLTVPIDFRGNGRPDIFLCHAEYADPTEPKVPCRVLRIEANGSLTEITRDLFGHGALPSINWPHGVVVGDFNHDGRPDIFVLGNGFEPSFRGETNLLLVSSADGTYVDRSSTLPQELAEGYYGCSADMDGDGNLDILVGNFNGGQLRIGPYFLMGKGDGSFTQTTRGLPPEIVDVSAGHPKASCALVDVNRDGYPDLVLGTFGASPHFDSIVLFNDGTGDFTRRTRYVLPPGPLGDGGGEMQQIVALDINRDGFPDFVALWADHPNYQGFALQFLINRGDGTFVDATATRLLGPASYKPGPLCERLGVADLNGDGWKDFFCTHSGKSTLDAARFWISSGNGTWSPLKTNPALSAGALTSKWLDAVDVDGDGQVDLVWVFPGMAGNLHFESYKNRSPRTAPIPKYVVEFYNSTLDHYFISWVPDEIALLDAGTTIKGWTRTGKAFRTFSGPPSEVTDVCRIYIIPEKGNSHFYGRSTKECSDAMNAHPEFILEDAKFMAMRLPTAGVCPFGLVPVYRVFSNRPDVNHRYMTDKATRTAMVSKGWLAEGEGSDLVVMCAGQ